MKLCVASKKNKTHIYTILFMIFFLFINFLYIIFNALYSCVLIIYVGILREHGCFFIISICIFYQSTIVLACKTLGHSLVTSRLDYGNAVLYGTSDRLLHRLEMVQRSAARVVLRIRRGDWPFNNCAGSPQSIASSTRYSL